MAGYTRQSTGNIVAGQPITATPLNNEFDALQTAFSAGSGHTHDGSTGSSPKINLTTSVSQILPAANGGTGLTTIAGFVTLTGTETLTNKTLTNPNINSGSINGTISGASAVFTGSNTKIQASNATTSTTYLRFFPSDRGAGKPELTVQKNATATKWDILLDDGTGSTGTINFISTILTWNDIGLVNLTTSQTLTNKTLTSPTINAATLTGSISGGTLTGTTLTSPTINAATLTGTLAGGTFTGTTLTSPTINTPTLTGGTVNPGTLQQSGSQAYVRNNILVAVAQSAGVPTGGIIESAVVVGIGRNYIKYADGTMICALTDAGTDTTTASGALFRGASSITVTFPVAFTNTPKVWGSANGVSRWLAFAAPTSTTVDYNIISHLSSAVVTPADIVAIGRWF